MLLENGDYWLTVDEKDGSIILKIGTDYGEHLAIEDSPRGARDLANTLNEVADNAE